MRVGVRNTHLSSNSGGAWNAARKLAAVAAAALVLLAAGCGSGISPVRVGSWGGAIEVPGLGALNKGADFGDVLGVFSLSCASAGNCAAGGEYRDGDRQEQGFVADERHGVWGRAVEVPGLGALNKGGSAEVDSVSCASAGNCAAGGYYQDGDRQEQGFVAVEESGRWSKAIEVPGLGALNENGNVEELSVSCASAGNCAAGGDYANRDRQEQGFVVSEKNGRWGTAVEVPGLGTLNTGGDVEEFSVSCGSAGNCAAGGDYTVGGGKTQAFVVSEENGVWGEAIEIPGLGALNKGGGADVYSLSCASPGNCAVGGDYTDARDNGQGFVAVEKNGRWGYAIEVPGLGALNGGMNAEVDSVSCPLAGNCAAVGVYGGPYDQGFVVSEKNGVWGKAITEPGLVTLNGRIGGPNSVSCASPGNCAAGGSYSDSSGGGSQGFVAVERHGRWGKAIEVPGLGALNEGGYAFVSAVSCASPGSCAAGGSYTDYTDGHRHYQGFVVSQAG